MICAFSGHRPQSLPWQNDEEDSRCAALKLMLEREIEKVYHEGCRTFSCGMARGCDLYFAEVVLHLKQTGRCPDAALRALLPCPEQTSRWTEAEQSRQKKLLLACQSVRVLEPRYTTGCMLRRNRALVDECDVLMTVFCGTEGGTAATVRYAKRCGKTILPLWL